MKIIWSTLAKDYYIYIIEKLFEKWNIKIVEKFEREITNLIYIFQITIKFVHSQKLLIIINAS